jgi:hypothetical protein
MRAKNNLRFAKMQMKLDLQLAGRMALLSGHNIGEILQTQRHVNARNEVGYVRKKNHKSFMKTALFFIYVDL